MAEGDRGGSGRFSPLDRPVLFDATAILWYPPDMPPTKVIPLAVASIPVRCLEKKPTAQTVYFMETPINLRRIAESYTPPLDIPNLSRIFAGRQFPSLRYARYIANAIGMTLDSFLGELERKYGRLPEDLTTVKDAVSRHESIGLTP